MAPLGNYDQLSPSHSQSNWLKNPSQPIRRGERERYIYILYIINIYIYIFTIYLIFPLSEHFIEYGISDVVR